MSCKLLLWVQGTHYRLLIIRVYCFIKEIQVGALLYNSFNTNASGYLTTQTTRAALIEMSVI